MKIPQYLVQMGIDQPFYLDSWNGGDTWEWTPNEKTAWHMGLLEAERHLARVQELFEDALLLEV